MDEQETEVEHKRGTEKRSAGKWVGRIFKILFCVTAVLLIIFTVMANIGGASDPLKRSIEGYVSESTGMNARVGKLNNMSFFPDVAFDFEETEISPRGRMDAVMAIGKVQVAFGFWDVMFGTGKVKVINIENFRALPGYLIESDVRIDKISIVEETEGAHMQSTGEIGGKAFTVRSNMEASGLGRGRKYSFGNERTINISIGDSIAVAMMKGGKGSNIILEDIDIKSGDKKVMSGKIDLARGGGKIFITGTLRMEPNGSDIMPEIGFYLRPHVDGTHGLEGVLKSDRFDTADFISGSPYDGLMKTVEGAFGVRDITRTFPVSLDIRSLYKDGSEAGSFSGHLPLKGWRIDTAALAK